MVEDEVLHDVSTNVTIPNRQALVASPSLPGTADASEAGVSEGPAITRSLAKPEDAPVTVPRCQPPAISFRVTLAFLFSIVAISTALIVWKTTSDTYDDSIDELSQQVMEEMAYKVSQYLLCFFGAATTLSDGSMWAFERAPPDRKFDTAWKTASIIESAMVVMGGNPCMHGIWTGVACADQTICLAIGAVADVGDDNRFFLWEMDEEHNVHITYRTRNLTVTSYLTAFAPYASVWNISWYQQAMDLPKDSSVPQLSPPLSFSMGRKRMNAVNYLRRIPSSLLENREPLMHDCAVSTTVVLGKEVKLFLQSQTPHNGLAFLLSEDGELLADTSNEDVWGADSVGLSAAYRLEGTSVEKAIESDHPLIREVAQMIGHRTHEVSELNFDFDGNRFVGRATPLSSTNDEQNAILDGLGWMLVVVAPESFFYGSLTEIGSRTFLVVVFSATTSIIVSVIFSYILARDLSKIDKEVARVADGDFEDQEQGAFTFGIHAEMRRIRDSLASMRRNIRSLTGGLNLARDVARKAHAEAESVVAQQKRFLASMSHEIRTPLAGIVGMASFLAASQLTREQQDWVNCVSSSADWLLQVLNDILDISKVEAGKMCLDQQPINILSVVEQTVGVFSKNVHKKNVELYIKFDPTMPRNFIGDPLRLRQILGNLISNATKFTESGHICVEIRPSDTSKAGLFGIVIEVVDTGCGIAPSELSTLFFPYSRAATTAHHAHGIGLGLDISQRLARLMHGDICCSSAGIGQGSTFKVAIHLEPDPHIHRCEWVHVSEFPELQRHPALLVLARAQVREGLVMICNASSVKADTIASSQALVAQKGNLESYAAIIVDEALVASELWTETENSTDEESEDGCLHGRRKRVLSRIYELQQQLGPDRPPTILLGRYKAKRDGDYSVEEIAKPIIPSSFLSTVEEYLASVKLSEPVLRQEAVLLEKSSPKEFPGLRILVVEDNRINQKVVTRMLSQLGCIVDLADNGQVGLNMATEHPYGVIFMDCEMPVMSGYESTSAIRKHEATTGTHVPIIALTAHAMSSDRDRCFACGMDGYCTKPVTSVFLRDILRRHARGV